MYSIPTLSLHQVISRSPCGPVENVVASHIYILILSKQPAVIIVGTSNASLHVQTTVKVLSGDAHYAVGKRQKLHLKCKNHKSIACGSLFRMIMFIQVILLTNFIILLKSFHFTEYNLKRWNYKKTEDDQWSCKGGLEFAVLTPPTSNHK